MGDVPRDVLVGLSDALAAYGLRCEIQATAPVPADALDPRRGQYRAEGLLAQVPVGRKRAVLAVTFVDLFAEGLNFVFGLANLGSPGALVSAHRLHDADGGLLLERLVRECVHELGHTWGLPHCAEEACVMRFSNSLREVDAKGRAFCESCRSSVPVVVGRARGGPRRAATASPPRTSR